MWVGGVRGGEVILLGETELSFVYMYCLDLARCSGMVVSLHNTRPNLRWR
jgi:hypothetical protein